MGDGLITEVGAMIFYTQSLTGPFQSGLDESAGPPEGQAVPRRQVGASVEAPMVVTGIPLDQPDPATSQTLRQMALHLEGISQVSFGC